MTSQPSDRTFLKMWKMDEKRKGSTECMRYCFLLTNSLFLVLGLLLLFFGVWFYAVPANENVGSITLSSGEQSQLSMVSALIICMGVGIFLVAVTSCCGAFANSKCILIMISIFMAILLLLEIVIAIFGIVFYQEIKVGITDHMAETLAYNYSGDDATDSVSLAWKEVQETFSCCGVNTTLGYQNHTNVQVGNVTGSLWFREFGNNSGLEWPESCCKQLKGNHSDRISCSMYGGSDIYLSEVGCVDKVQTFLQTHIVAISLIAVVLLLFEVLALIISYKLYKSIPANGKIVEKEGYSEMTAN